MYPIGIDLGTTNSCIGVWRTERVEIIPNKLGSRTTPSWVTFDKTTGQPIVGEPARRQAATNPKRTVSDVKRLMGRRFAEIEQDLDNYTYDIVQDGYGYPLIKIDEKTYKPEEISAMILAYLKETAETFLGVAVKKVVITVPAYFNDAQRQATKNAATIAGLDCSRIINEPTAACLCYGFDSSNQIRYDRNDRTVDDSRNRTVDRNDRDLTVQPICDRRNRCEDQNDRTVELNILVFDLGGGTFDVSVLNLNEGVFQVLATAGDTHLGGADLDWALTSYISKNADLNSNRLKRLQLACEKAKCELSSTHSTQIYIDNFYPDGEPLDTTVTRQQFEQLIEPFIERCGLVGSAERNQPIQVLKEHGIRNELIRNEHGNQNGILTQVLKDAQLEREQIDEIVLVGGSTRIPLLQQRLSTYFNNKRLNHSVDPDEAVAYGATVQAAILSNSDENSKVQSLVLLDVAPLSLGIETSGGTMARIIERNTNIPCQQSKMFTTAEDNQESVLIKVYEGERKFTCDNSCLGTFELGPLPAAPRGIPKIRVTFTIDSNGILQVTALDQNTGLETKAQLTPESGRLTATQIQEMIRHADAYKIKDEQRQATLEAVTTFERYLYNVQQAVNDANLNDSLTVEERSFVNQYLLNSFQWISSNLSENIDREAVLQAHQSVEYTLKPLIQKLYSHA